MNATSTTTPATTEPPKKGTSWNYLYLALALFIGYEAFGLLSLKNNSKGKKLTVEAGGAFNVHHDIVASGADSVATYILPEGSVTLFNMTNANARFVEMGHIKITANGKTVGRCNGKWDTPGTPDDIFQYATVWQIESISESTISFTAKTKN